jgi:hypothetical protein
MLWCQCDLSKETVRLVLCLPSGRQFEPLACCCQVMLGSDEPVPHEFLLGIHKAPFLFQKEEVCRKWEIDSIASC